MKPEIKIEKYKSSFDITGAWEILNLYLIEFLFY